MGILKGPRTCEKASLRARERWAAERRQPEAVNDASAERYRSQSCSSHHIKGVEYPLCLYDCFNQFTSVCVKFNDAKSSNLETKSLSLLSIFVKR